MMRVDQLANVRPCVESDDPFLYDIFATTWESEVAALPNPNLALHVLRIQHIAQERRFASRYPGYQRFVVLCEESPAGRLYVREQGPSLHVVDLTLLPEFRSQGIGTRLFQDLFDAATREGRSITMRVSRSNRRATDLYASLGFRLMSVDDLDNYFEWTPDVAPAPAAQRSESTPLSDGVESR